MKQHQLYYHLISLLLALSIIGAVGCVSAFAQPDEEGGQPEVITDQGEPEAQNEPGQDGQSGEEEYQEPQQDYQPHEEPNQWYDPVYGYDEDVTSAYVEPEHLGELPAVNPTQVVEATSVAIPVVAVSDASLFSGIVMWLCVALGIAVVVGVLVSRRTRRG